MCIRDSPHRLVVPDRFALIVTDLQGLVVAYVGGVIVKDDLVIVFLSVDKDLFAAGLVFKAKLIEAIAFVGVGLDRTLAPLSGKRIGRRLLRVVDCSCDQWLIGISF